MKTAPRGYAAIVWGALLLRVRLARPKVDDVAFFRYRRDWNKRIQRGFGFDVKVHGPMPSPATLIVSNHAGFADINTLCAECPPEAMLNFISKIEIGRLPIFGWHMAIYGDVLFDRQNPEARKAVVDDTLARIRKGFSVVLFPEGTRAKDGRPKEEIRPAMIEAAIRESIPIQPCAVLGTHRVIEDLHYPRRGQPIRMYLGETRRDYKDAPSVWREVRALWAQGEPEYEEALAKRRGAKRA